MSASEKDEVPMLYDTPGRSVAEDVDSQFTRWPRARSASLSIDMPSMEGHERETNLVGHTGPLMSQRTPFVAMSGPLSSTRRRPDSIPRPGLVTSGQKEAVLKMEKFPSMSERAQNEWPSDKLGLKNEHLLRSGQLGMCNDPYCTTCPSYYHYRAPPQKHTKASSLFDSHFHSAYGDAKGWARRFFSFLSPYFPGVINPHAQVVQQWSKFFVISCLIAIFVDPLFFFLLSVQKDYKCIVLNFPMTKTLVVFRSLTDFVYLLHIILQINCTFQERIRDGIKYDGCRAFSALIGNLFRLAYVAPESLVVGAGELVDHPKKIARNYLHGYFFLDFFIVLPLPQIIILLVIPQHLGSSGANYAKNLLRAFILVQYIPRLYRFLPLLAGQSPIGFIFESAWANFIINLLTFVLAGHVVGSGWYLFGLQRVNQCLRDACRNTENDKMCKFIDCGHGSDDDNLDLDRNAWKINVNASACLTEDGFPYGIYLKAVNLTTQDSVATRYVYSLFWGFQQISTLAGNQTPSYFVWEVAFTMLIIGLGLLLFALLIGNMQNFLQALGKRRLEMSLRRRDVEQWMSHRRLPIELRRKVRQAERYNWAATRGVNEEMLLENLPEDLQREIRRHLFKFVKKVRIFALMDDPIIDAICEKLRQKTYIKGSKILYHGGLIDKMTFVVRGKMESSVDNVIFDPLSERDVCGEELLTWCLEHSSVNKDAKKIRIPGKRLLSNRTVVCLTNVEAFSLRAADLEEVTSLYSRLLRNPRVQGAIRYESPYWRGLAAARIQVAWRYRKKRLNRADTSQSSQSPSKRA